MSYDLIAQRPTTVLGLKNKAKKLSRLMGIKHAEALDEAARQSGARGFPHFLQLFGGRAESDRYRHEIRLEQDWIDNAEQTRRAVLRLRVSRPINDLPCRGIGRLPRIKVRRRRGDAFLLHPWSGQDEGSARDDLMRAARCIQFADATGLALGASKSQSTYPRYKGLDHSSAWTNPLTGRSLHVDEQYMNSPSQFIGTFDEEGVKWCRQNGFNWVKPKWAGMYCPQGDCEFVLISHNDWGEALGPIVEKLENYAPAVLPRTADFLV